MEFFVKINNGYYLPVSNKYVGSYQFAKPSSRCSPTLTDTTGEDLLYALRDNPKETMIKDVEKRFAEVDLPQRGFKDEHYKKMILELIGKYGKASKSDIDKLLLDILPGVLDDKQKANKIWNIVYSMSKRDKIIENQGTSRYPKWILSSSKRLNDEKIR
jgi:hypothetical protein